MATLSRPETRNAIDVGMIDELHDLCTELERRPRLLVVTGTGPVFAAGADLRQMRERTPEDALRGINSGLFERLAALPMPTVAALNGPAFGAGAELAYACDFRLATPTVRIGNPEVSLGVIPGAGAAWRLRQLVGLSLTRQMLLAGRILDADESLAAGLVDEVVADGDLEAAVGRWVDRLEQGAPLALRLTKLALAAPDGAHPRFDDVAQAVLFGSDEKWERMTAVLERRRPAAGARPPAEDAAGR